MKPENLSPKGEAAYAAVMQLIEKYELSDGGCKTFYSPTEWAARGERYGVNSELVIVYDGGEVNKLCQIDGKFNDELVAALQPHGLFVEECTGWYAAIYNI